MGPNQVTNQVLFGTDEDFDDEMIMVTNSSSAYSYPAENLPNHGSIWRSLKCGDGGEWRK